MALIQHGPHDTHQLRDQLFPDHVNQGADDYLHDQLRESRKVSAKIINCFFQHYLCLHKSSTTSFQIRTIYDKFTTGDLPDSAQFYHSRLSGVNAGKIVCYGRSGLLFS